MIGGKNDVLKQIVEAFENLESENTVYDCPDASYDNESETVTLTYGAGYGIAVYVVNVERVY